MRIIVCGSRNWEDKNFLNEILDRELMKFRNHEITIIQGEARGADILAREWAKTNNINCESYPANWEVYGRAAGPIRNQEMLESGVDLIIAFTLDRNKSKGTKDMISRGKKAGVKVKVFGENNKQETLF